MDETIPFTSRFVAGTFSAAFGFLLISSKSLVQADSTERKMSIFKNMPHAFVYTNNYFLAKEAIKNISEKIN